MPKMADLQSNYVRKQLQGRKPQGEMVHAGGSLVNSKDSTIMLSTRILLFHL